VPVLFGVAVILLWEGIVRGLGVPEVILPAPSVILATMAANTGLLWSDFVQTIVKGALSGYAIGCTAAVLVAVAIDRSPFLPAGSCPSATSSRRCPSWGSRRSW
jgi:NitT/TauT family transport system permease protein